MSTELPVATRHRRDMTEKLLKATSNPKYTHTHLKITSISFVQINNVESAMRTKLTFLVLKVKRSSKQIKDSTVQEQRGSFLTEDNPSEFEFRNGSLGM